MDKELIFIGSVTKAMRARDLLRRHRIEVSVERDADNKNGCGYGVLVINDNAGYARQLLADNGFRL